MKTNDVKTSSPPILSQAEVDLLTLDMFLKIKASYQPGRDRKVTPENVYQEAVLEGRDTLEQFLENFLLPGSAIEGVEHMDDCLARIGRGERVLFLPEHRGNLDTPSFYVLLRREGLRFETILERLVYIAGRKLNESSEQIKMFTEKYSRLIIVPRRDLPEAAPGEAKPDRQAQQAYLKSAARINRAAFRALIRLRGEGKIFVLFPLGGRFKPGADNSPVPETISYLRAFGTAYLISMEGNLLKPRPNMEDERPEQEKIVFRVGPPLDCKKFLAGQRAIFDRAAGEGALPDEMEYDRFAVNRIMRMLEDLRLKGCFDPNF